jgi:hypothetical protein
MAYKGDASGGARSRHSNREPFMRKLFLILALAGGAAVAQTQPLPEPAPPMVPAVRLPLGAASRAARHEDFARERALRAAEKVEDRADAEQKRKDNAGKLRRMER